MPDFHGVGAANCIEPSHMPKSISQSLSKALLAGLVGGLVGAAAKVAAEKLFPPRTQGQTPPPEQVIERAAAALETDLPPLAKKIAQEGLHWGFGTIAGGIYGIAAEYQPRVTAWRGGVFGLTVNRLMHQGMLPRTGLVEEVKEQPYQERISEWVTHVVYGVVTESVRRVVRKRL